MKFFVLNGLYPIYEKFTSSYHNAGSSYSLSLFLPPLSHTHRHTHTPAFARGVSSNSLSSISLFSPKETPLDVFPKMSLPVVLTFYGSTQKPLTEPNAATVLVYMVSFPTLAGLSLTR